MSTYLHHVPGRLRVRLPALARDPRRVVEITALIGAQEGVTAVEFNSRAASLLVRYDPARLGPEVLLERLRVAGAMGLGPTAPAAAEAFGTAVGKVLVGALFQRSLKGSLAGLAVAALRR